MRSSFLLVFGFLRIEQFLHSQSIRIDDVLPNDYDHLLPPKLKGDLPVNVSVSLYVIQIRSVNEIEMNFKMDLVLRQVWEDPRLIFPESLIGKRDQVVLDSSWGSDIWTPDVWFKNALHTKMQEWVTPSIFYWFMSNKTVFFSGRVTLELTCDMNMQNYPHDSQFCGVSIISLMNPSTDVRLDWMYPEPIRLSKIMNLPQFEVRNMSLSRCDTNMYEEVFSCIDGSFTLIRRSGYFLITIYIPTVLIVCMSMLAFWIPPEAAPARITLGVTSLLTIITKQSHSPMPGVSYVVALNVWLSACIAFVFGSLLQYAVLLSFGKRNHITPLHAQEGDNDSGINTSRKSLKGAWTQRRWISFNKFSPQYIDLISRFLFPIAFLVFSITYACTYGK